MDSNKLGMLEEYNLSDDLRKKMTDKYTKSEVDSLLSQKADLNYTYTKEELDAKILTLANELSLATKDDVSKAVNDHNIDTNPHETAFNAVNTRIDNIVSLFKDFNGISIVDNKTTLETTDKKENTLYIVLEDANNSGATSLYLYKNSTLKPISGGGSTTDSVMLKSIYDINKDGVVDLAEALRGCKLSGAELNALYDNFSALSNHITNELEITVNGHTEKINKIEQDLANVTETKVQELIDKSIGELIDNSPEALNTLKELSNALGNDPNFSTTVLNKISEKQKRIIMSNTEPVSSDDVVLEENDLWINTSLNDLSLKIYKSNAWQSISSGGSSNEKEIYKGNTEPEDKTKIWIDTTDESKPSLRIYNGTEWKTISSDISGITEYDSYNNLKDIVPSGDKNNISLCNNDYIDPSTNTKYKKGFYKYNTENNKWIEIYKIFDYEDILNEVKGNIIEANLRTYTGEELDYALISLKDHIQDYTPTKDEDVPFDMAIKITKGLEFNEQNHSVKLKANHSYKISGYVRLLNKKRFEYFKLYDITNNLWIGSFGFDEHQDLGSDSIVNSIAFYTPLVDSEVTLRFTAMAGAEGSGILQAEATRLVVEEVHRQIIIDPAETCEENKGVEAVPVGHEVSYIGSIAPKHYVFKDGSVYNIADYPYLAQHILDNYGSVNIFGGDGITTFAVPNEINHDNTIWYHTNMTSNTEPSPLVASASSVHTEGLYDAFNVFDGNNNTIWQNNISIENPIPAWIQIDFGRKCRISSFRIFPREGNLYTQCPNVFELQGSNDGITFDTIKAYSGVTWNANDYTVFHLDSVYEYRYYRLSISSSNFSDDRNAISFAKLEFGIRNLKIIKAEPTYNINYAPKFAYINQTVLFEGEAIETDKKYALLDDVSNYDTIRIYALNSSQAICTEIDPSIPNKSCVISMSWSPTWYYSINFGLYKNQLTIYNHTESSAEIGKYFIYKVVGIKCSEKTISGGSESAESINFTREW